MDGFFAILEFIAGTVGGWCDAVGQCGTVSKRITIALLAVCVVMWAVLTVAIIYLLVLAQSEGRSMWWG